MTDGMIERVAWEIIDAIESRAMGSMCVPEGRDIRSVAIDTGTRRIDMIAAARAVIAAMREQIGRAHV